MEIGEWQWKTDVMIAFSSVLVLCAKSFREDAAIFWQSANHQESSDSSNLPPAIRPKKAYYGSKKYKYDLETANATVFGLITVLAVFLSYFLLLFLYTDLAKSDLITEVKGLDLIEAEQLIGRETAKIFTRGK